MNELLSWRRIGNRLGVFAIGYPIPTSASPQYLPVRKRLTVRIECEDSIPNASRYIRN